MNTYRILHADDEFPILEVVQDLLHSRVRAKPYRVEYVGISTAEEFFRRYGKGFPIAVIDNDLSYPNEGFQTLLRLGREEKLTGKNFLYSSSFSSEQKEVLESFGVTCLYKENPIVLVNSLVALLDAEESS